MSGLPTTRLHGDAHIEQYALTRAARGLDDFDDSAVGPAVIDLVRFLGSIDLALRNRAVAGQRPAAVRPVPRRLPARARRSSLPAAGTRHRATTPVGHPADGGGLPDLGGIAHGARDGRRNARPRRLAAAYRGPDAHASGPSSPPATCAPKRFGWLRTGIGSALTQKALARVEGPGPGDDDDLILEVKQLSDLAGVPCLTEHRGRRGSRRHRQRAAQPARPRHPGGRAAAVAGGPRRGGVVGAQLGSVVRGSHAGRLRIGCRAGGSGPRCRRATRGRRHPGSRRLRAAAETRGGARRCWPGWSRASGWWPAQLAEELVAAVDGVQGRPWPSAAARP